MTSRLCVKCIEINMFVCSQTIFICLIWYSMERHHIILSLPHKNLQRQINQYLNSEVLYFSNILVYLGTNKQCSRCNDENTGCTNLLYRRSLETSQYTVYNTSEFMQLGTVHHPLAGAFSCPFLFTEYFVCTPPGISENNATNNALSINASVHAHSLRAICGGLCLSVLHEYKQSFTKVLLKLNKNITPMSPPGLCTYITTTRNKEMS